MCFAAAAAGLNGAAVQRCYLSLELNSPFVTQFTLELFRNAQARALVSSFALLLAFGCSRRRSTAEAVDTVNSAVATMTDVGVDVGVAVSSVLAASAIVVVAIVVAGAQFWSKFVIYLKI